MAQSPSRWPESSADLSPNSVEFARFYANLFYEVADDGKEFEEVVAECERALKIDEPNDPVAENPLF